MAALAVDGLVMYGLGMIILLELLTKGLFASADRAWRRYRADPVRGSRGNLGRIVAGGMACRSLAELQHYFDGVRQAEVVPFERNLKVMNVAVGAAPLLGLLGTVMGMLTTFHALATGGGGEKTMDIVAGGISEALVTTETGLVLALTGLVFQYALTRQHQRYEKTIAHLETLCMQYRRRQSGGGQAAPAEEPVQAGGAHESVQGFVEGRVERARC
jgi:biopolymer transport protein ExbB